MSFVKNLALGGKLRFFICLLILFSFSFSQQFDEFADEFSTHKNVFDPLSGYNRVVSSFNDFFYTNLANPVANAYRYVVAEPARNAVSNFFDNLLFPIRFINNILQFKFKNATDETLRFVANTIVGFGGISDVATTYYNIPRHDEDFGQTLGYWGFGSGFHIVLPFLGPSNLRDIFGLGGDYFVNPISYITPQSDRIVVGGYRVLNKYSKYPDAYEKIKKGAIDLYPFLRDSYEQRRQYLIKE